MPDKRPLETASAANGGRIVVVDVTKGLCILTIIFNHVDRIPQSLRYYILHPFTILPSVPLFLMLSVYMWCAGEERKQGTIQSWFRIKAFNRRLVRFLLPFAIIVALTVEGLFVFAHIKRISLLSVFTMIEQGGRGPANFYVVILFQLLILFPFLRYAFCKRPFIATLSFVLLQLLYETLCRYVWEMPVIPYNSLIFRYLTHLALGFLLYYYKDEILDSAIPVVSMVIGAIYLINTYYLGYEQLSVYNHATRSMIAVLYSFGLLCLILRAEPYVKPYARALKPLILVGNASYHIMLWQMVYFYFARYTHFEDRFENLGIRILVDLAIGLIGGIAWYLLSRLFRGIFKRK